MTEAVGYRDQVGLPPSSARNTRDIRKFIAQSQTPQMDPNNFPVKEYQRYPLMIMGPDKKPYTDVAGRPIVVRNAEEEEDFHKEHPDAIRVQDPIDMVTELEQLRAENAKLKAAQGDAPVEDDPPKEEPTKAKPLAGMVKGKPTGPLPGSKLE